MSNARLVAGLGNPGREYARNRHNIGFMVVDELSRRHRVDAFRGKFGGEVAQGEIAGHKVILLKPMEYMNLSGRAVQRAAAFYQVEPKDIVVVHDEIDLELGRLKLKVGGGHAGHNGIRSIIQDLGSAEFVRVRLGVGRPGGGGGGNVSNHVLGDFGKAEQTEAEILIKEAADAVEEVLEKGPLLAMNKWNSSARDDDRGT
jgi:PTH1 family peptidyl-tRNA hydrolase